MIGYDDTLTRRAECLQVQIRRLEQERDKLIETLADTQGDVMRLRRLVRWLLVMWAYRTMERRRARTRGV